MMGKTLNTIRWPLVALTTMGVQRCYGQTGMQAVLLQAHDHDTCGFDREATEVSSLVRNRKGSS